MAASAASAIYLLFATAMDGNGLRILASLIPLLAAAMGIPVLTIGTFRSYVLEAAGSVALATRPPHDPTGWIEVLNFIEAANPGQVGLSNPQVRQRRESCFAGFCETR